VLVQRGGSRFRWVAMIVVVLVAAAGISQSTPEISDRGPAGKSHGILNADSPLAIRGEFIVGLDPRLAGDAVEATAQRLVDRYDGKVGKVWPLIRAFALAATEKQASRMAEDPIVKYVEQNQHAQRHDTQSGPTLPWHLDRDDQERLPLDFKYNYPLSSVPIYVMDSGVRVTHDEFDELPPRVTAVKNTVPNVPNEDCTGHGTAVASIAGGKTKGVAKRSPIRSVKVDDCQSTATETTVVDGLLWLATDSSVPRPAVVNMSFSFFGQMPGLNAAVEVGVITGLTFVVAAGNHRGDGCNRTPNHLAESVPGVIVVAATDQLDTQWSESNWGACVTLFAPGTAIEAASHQADNLYVPEPVNGTSYSAPQVAGAAAMILTDHPTYTPAQVRAALVADATRGVITLLPNRPAPNLLLYIPPPDQPATATSSNLNELFRVYGDQGGHWTGGDETVSVQLSDNRVAWIFGDTMLGTVNPDGSRPRNTPMINNSMVVQEGNSLVRTLYNLTPEGRPTALVGGPNERWWPGDGQVVGDELQVFYYRVDDGADGAFSFVTKEIGIARFAESDLTLRGLTKLPALTPQSGGRNINWGTVMVDGTDNFTYIYGVENANGQNQLHVARAPKGQVLNTSQWRFWTGTWFVAGQWSANEADSRGTTTGMGSSFGVKYLASEKKYVLVTMDTSQPFTNRLVAFYADEPTGPFRHQTLLYKAPEATGARYVYNARIHQRASTTGNTLLVSYNVNSFNEDDLYNDARMYRPRFVNVTIPPLLPDNSLLPAAPKNLRASSPAAGQVRLQWTAPPGTNLKYWIYERRMESVSTQFTRAQNSVTVTDTTFGVLRPGLYEYRVSAENAVGEGPPSLPAMVDVAMPKPATAPTLSAAANPDGSVTLSWTPVTAAGIVNYRVYQRDVTAGQTDFAVSRAVPTGTTVKISGLEDGHTYAWYVLAFNGGGDGPKSNTVQATSNVAPPPAPTNLTATANGDGTITLNWTAPAPGLWYWIEQRNASKTEAFARLPYPLTTGGTTFTAGLLTVGDTYEFRVIAIGPTGKESPPSNVARATARRDPPPAPTNLTATANNDATITLSWNSSGAGVWYWLYGRNASKDESFTRFQYPVTTGTTFTASWLTAGETYEYKVTAIGADGAESQPSNIAQATARATPPPAPTNLTATANSDGSITLNWRHAGNDTWFWVYQRNATDGQQFAHGPYPAAGVTTFTATGLVLGKTYEFRITAIGLGSVESAPSNTASAVARVAPPAAPTNLRAVPGDSQVTLTWNSSGPGVWYWLYQRTVPSGSFVRYQYPVTTGTTFTPTMLANGTTYEWYVTAIGSDGSESPRSNLAQAVPQMALPAAPTNLTATPNNDGTIRLSWTAPAPNLWYWVYTRVGTSGNFTRSIYPLTTGGTTFTAAFLTIGQTYSFRVSAINAGGEGPLSNIATATSTVPAPPAPSLVASPLPNGSIHLNWSSSGSGIWYWIEMRDVSASGGWVRLPLPVANATEFIVTSVRTFRTYDFRVIPIYAGGNGPASNIVRAMSKVVSPTGLIGWWTGRTSVYLAWNSNLSGALYWVYIRDVSNSGNWTRQAYPISGRNWTTIVPLLSNTYDFYVTQVTAAGESDPSPTVRVSAPFPVSPPGSVDVGLGTIPISCDVGTPISKTCRTTVIVRGTLSGWPTTFQYAGLHLIWRIWQGGNLTTRWASCSGASPISYCEQFTSYVVTWSNAPSAPPAANAPTICVDLDGHGYYFLDPAGNLTRVSRGASRCVTPS